MDGETRAGTRQGVACPKEETGQNNGRKILGVVHLQESQKAKLKKIAKQGIVCDDWGHFIIMKEEFKRTKATGSILFKTYEFVFWQGSFRGSFKSDLVPPDDL